MADNTLLNAGTGGDTIATDDIAGVKYPISKLAHGALDSATIVSTASGLPVQQQGTWTVTGAGGTFPVTDSGGNLSVDWAGTVPPIGAGTEAAALRVTVATDSTGVLSVDDNGSTITIDNTNIDNLAPFDFDSGAGTDTTPAIGIAVAASGGAAAITGDVTNGLDVDVTRVSGNVTVVGTGTFAAQVTVAASATNIAKAEDVASADADVGVPALAVRKATPANTSGTDGDYEFLQMSAGRLWVDASGVTLTVGSHAVTNAGTFAVQIDSGAVTSLALLDDVIVADDAAFTPATTKVSMAGFTADETSTDSVDEGDAGAARITLDRKLITTIYPHTAGGLTTMNASSSDGATALTSTAQVIKASAGQLYGYYIYNPNSSAQFVQFYNTAAASVTVGTTNPLFMLTIPATSAANLMSAHGIAFSNAGWSWSATSTAGGNGAPTTALDAIAWYN